LPAVFGLVTFVSILGNSIMVDKNEENNGLSGLVAGWDEKIRDARKAGGIGAARRQDGIANLLATARQAVAAVERAIGPIMGPDDAQASALRVLRKITYNTAADAYPGWEVNGPPRSAAELAAAESLARKCLSLVETLDESAERHGNALWLIGALALAQGKRHEARKEFGAAADFFTQAETPLMTALCDGYIGIADEDGPAVDAAITKIGALEDKYAKDMIDQLVIARQVYGPAA
jgi:hypothetical protein